MFILRGEARFALRGWKDAMNVSLQETSVLKRKIFILPCQHTESPHVVCLRVRRADSVQCFEGRAAVYPERPRAIGKMKPSVVVALVSGRMTEARLAASKAADSHQAPTQPRETEAGVLTAWQHMLKGSDSSRDGMLLSAVVELSVRPGHQAVTASVCSAQIFSYLA